MAATKTPEINIATLSLADQVALLKQLNESVQTKRVEMLEVLTTEFKDKIINNGFTMLEAVTALRAHYPNAQQPQTEAPKAKRGQSYKHPTTGEVWTKNEAGKGKDVAWLQGFIAQGRKYEEFECETPTAK